MASKCGRALAGARVVRIKTTLVWQKILAALVAQPAFRYRIAKKVSVFAVTFFMIGGLIAITALSPPSGVGAILHRPPVDFGQRVQFPDQATLRSLLGMTTGAQRVTVEEEEALPAFARMPTAGPLRPHVDPFGFFYLEEVPLSYNLQRYIFERSAQLGLEYELILALIWRESTFRVEAMNINRNGTQDSGLMQINDVNRGWLYDQHGIYNLMDPHQNIDAGTYMIADLLSRYSESYALMAYQLGEGGMRRAVENGRSGSDFARTVQSKRDEFRAIRAQVYAEL
ncbi:MAG: lytic transglycosylase domain-containing protein [Oscillospiraceae bacterium]|nr:lytic transglycosylase domain-containing protein [Oscillospiraceae bacterium]